MATPLHNHSYFSVPSGNDGLSSPEEIAKRVSDLGLSCCAITDHGTTAGYRDFSAAMAEKGIKPILGIETYQARSHRLDRPEKRGARDGAHLVLLAQNPTGLGNIMRLSDEANKTGFYYHPRVDWELLEKNNEGVIATSACLSGLVSRGIQEGDLEPLNRYLNIFGENFFIELHTYDHPDQIALNKELVSIAQERGLPLVYANDAHYCSSDDFDMHEVLLNIRYRSNLGQSKGERSHHPDDESYYHPNSLYIMGEDEVRETLSYLPDNVVDEAIKNSDLIADMCDAQLPKPGRHLPVYNQPKEYKTSASMLIDLVEDGIEKLYSGTEIEDEAWERAEIELSQITEAGLSDYFLITWDWINWCHENHIMTGPGRGSSAGCILAFALGITHVCPIKYKLQFERFWNAGREDGLPDIDTDVPQARRAEVKKYLIDRWGADRVLSIGTIERSHPKGALRDCGPAIYGPSPELYADLSTITKIIDELNDAGKEPNWELIWQEKSEELSEYRERWPDMFDAAEDLEGRISGYSIHASAVVVSDIDLSEVLPSRLSARKGDDEGKGKELVTQVEMNEVESRGFLKLDVLGLRNLDTLTKTLELVPEMKGISPDGFFKSIDLDDLPEECYQLLDDKKTLGLFQIEEGGSARNIAKKLRPRSISDLAAIVALNRPGPLRSGAAERFLKRRNEEEVITYPHEILVDILGDTYGEMIYQEDVLAYFRKIGYSWSEADTIRYIMGKKKVQEMQDEYPRYLERAIKFMSEEKANEIWDLMQDFSKYGFNRSHAVAYAVVLAWCMYAKWRWPTEFIMASILTNPKKAGKYVSEGRRMGVEILPPCVNNSKVEISSKNGVIYFGLRDIKGIGPGTAAWIIDHGPYESYDHFLEVYEAAQEEHELIKDECKAQDKKVPRSPGQIVGKGRIEALVNAGAFDSIEDREIDLFEKAKHQEELLGLSLVDPYHELKAKYSESLAECSSILELNAVPVGEYVEISAIVKEIRKTKTKTGRNPGQSMAFVEVEWEDEQASIVVFPNAWEELRYTVKPQTMCIMEVKTGERGPILENLIRLD